MSDQQSRAEYVAPPHDEREATRLRAEEMKLRDAQLRAEVEALMAQKAATRTPGLPSPPGPGPTPPAAELISPQPTLGVINPELAFLRSENQQMSQRLGNIYHRERQLERVNVARGMLEAGGNCHDIFRQILDAIEMLAERD